MVNEELEAIIRSKFQEGARRAEIREALLEQGYDEHEIDTAISHIQHDAIKSLPVVAHFYQIIEDLENKTDHASPKFVAAVLAGCFAVLLMIFAGLYYFLDPLGIKTVERDKQRETDAVKIRTAIDAYRIAKGSYPSTLKDLVPEYLQSIPLDPKSGATYSYRSMNENRLYELCITFEVQPQQCLTPTADVSSQPMIIVTPTPMLSEIGEELLPEEASPSSDIIDEEEAPAVNPTVPPGTGTGELAL
jgi:hypothetical protein